MNKRKSNLYFEEHICAVLFSAILTMMFANVMCRYFLNYSLAFTEELIQILFIWASFMGAPIVCKLGVNLSFDVLAGLVPKNKQKYLTLLVQGLSIILFACLFWFGLRRTINQIQFRAVTPLMQFPVWCGSIAIPIGSGCYIFRSSQLVFTAFKGELR
ncbi:MAG: TRAP transporter small permease [Spirochaetales bacterium]|jgi:TRAP-type C4-dicarboxylate transport system permease small subunit|nr:TRAP transporter small permease [Spirochaetales bacterium]